MDIIKVYNNYLVDSGLKTGMTQVPIGSCDLDSGENYEVIMISDSGVVAKEFYVK